MEQVTEPAATGTYHIFINHRGTDVKLTLASLIYHRLTKCGLRVFLDREELRTGNTLCPAIQGAICSASVHILIFSENYVESRWCLNELCWILRSSHERTIITVFCDVDPSDLRYVYKGRYAEAFREQELNGKTDMEVIEGWKVALKEAAGICGLRFKTAESDQGKFLESIVENVLKVVKWEPLEVATHPVGLDQALEDLQNNILKQRATKVVGIAGIGGIGKSTLAKHLFNLKYSDFNRSCYLSNIRGKVELISLQRQLFCRLLGNDMNIPNTDLGKTILRNRLRGLKILIVLEDVDDIEKIKSLLDLDSVEPGSLILITSRDKSILRGSSANTWLYDVKPLKRKYAEELLCRHAFRQSKPFEGYEDLVEELLKICGGLPLCLKVLGEQLAGKLDISYWNRQLEMFSQGLPLPNTEAIINTLRWSYQALGTEEKEMLLDVGCFLVGENVELVVRVLEGLGYYIDVRNCLESLRQKCLLEFDNEVDYQYGNGSGGLDCLCLEGRHLIQPAVLPEGGSKIIMQNQIRELARHIVREDLRSVDKPLRLSCSADIVKMLQMHDGPGLPRIRGIRISKDQKPPQLTININITGIRLLIVEHPMDLCSFFGSGTSGDLVWLRWRNSHFIPFPSAISLRNLRILELQGPMYDIEKLFNNTDEIPKQLRELNIDAMEEGDPSSSSNSQSVDLRCWMKLSDRKISTTHKGFIPSLYYFLGQIGTIMTNLIKIVLKNITFLQLLPFEFSQLSNLRHLDLSGSTNLTQLPSSFSQLLRLQHLAFRDCENLSIPPDILGQISTLEYIDFKGCAQLTTLPQGIPSQTRLRYLNLLCTRLQELPLNLQLLGKLEQLRIGSELLTELPVSVASLKGLKELILFGCHTLDHIPPIEKCKLLQRLEIYKSAVQTISPPGIVGSKNIQVLIIDSCPISKFSFRTPGYLVDDDVMDALRDFTLNRTSISNIYIPGFVCPRLEIVDLSYNFQLMQVQVLSSTPVRLNLEDCSALKTLANLSSLVRLKFLNINGCVELETLNVEGLRSLEEISAEKCWKLQNIEAFSQLERINFLRVSRDLHGTHFSDALRSPSQTSTAIFSAEAHDDMNFEKAMQFILSGFPNLTVIDVPATTTDTAPVWIKNIHSHSALLMCFITYRFSRNGFRVNYEPSNKHAPCEEYNTVCGDGSEGILLHMYMWTEDSKLFKDESFYDEVAVYHYHKNPYSATYHDNIYHRRDGEKGWIVTLSSKTQAVELCNQIMLLRNIC